MRDSRSSSFVVPGGREPSGRKRKRPPQQPRVSNRTLAIIAVLLGVVCTLLVTLRFMLDTKRQGTDVATTQVETPGDGESPAGTDGDRPAPTPSVVAGQSADPSTASPLSSVAPVQQPNIESEPELKVVTKQLPGNDQGVMFHLTLTSDSRCMIGDVDVIRQELGHSPDSKLIVSIESLFPQTDPSPPVTREIALDRILTGARLSLFVPRSADVRHLGFFICKDSTGEGRCANKEIVDLNSVFQTYFPVGTIAKPLTNYKASDKVYFFQYLMLDGDTLHSFDTETTVRRPALLERFLVGKLDSAVAARSVVERVSFLNKVIRSIPLTISGSYILLDLPHIDPAACRVAGPKMSPEMEQAIRNELNAANLKP